MLGVFFLRLLLSWVNPDLVHPVDPAELGHLDVLPALADGRLLWLLGADANVHHGGFFWLGLPVGVLEALGGSALLAVRGMAAGCAAVAWGVWVALAHRLGGRWAAVGLGACLAVPSPWMAQWTATLWGSHAEAGIWTGVWGLALVSGWRPAALGALLGAGVAWDPLLWPTAVVVWLAGPARKALVVPWVLGWLFVRAPVLFADPFGVGTTSFSEHPEHTLLGLFAAFFDAPAAGLSALLHWPWLATEVVGTRVGAWNGVLTAVSALVAVLAVCLDGPTRTHRRWLVAAVAVHFAVLVTLTPMRNHLTERYLVAWWPAVLLLPWLLPGAWRALSLGPVVATLGAVPLLVSVVGALEVEHPGHPPVRLFQAIGLDRVPAERAPDVVTFLYHRGDSSTRGFAAPFSSRWGYPIWGEPFPVQVRAAGLTARLETARATADVAQVDRNFGFGLVVVCDRSVDCVSRGLDELALGDVATDAVLAGVAEAGLVLGTDVPADSGS